MGTTTTIVGGGIAGLVAAITAAEHGADVELHEARSQLGGRARSATGDFAANWGPHALYCDGSFWAWLAERDLLPPHAKPMRAGFRLRHRGRARRTPPKALLPAVRLYRHHRTAPVDVSFRDWVAAQCGDDTAAALSSLGGVLTMAHDPGALSAAFVWERMRRNATFPPVARYPLGGWTTLVDGLAARAGELGVRIAANSPVDHVSTERGPVVIAVEQPAARKLLGDESLGWHGARTALLDVGLEARRGDPFVVADLDEAGWVERFSGPDPSVAPTGRSLIQASMGLRPDEPLDAGVARIEALLDTAFAGWRDREVWRRRAGVDRQSGAVDPPGTTWRDRPAIDRGDGVFLAGDWVAAPGFYAEVAAASGVEAGRAAAGLSRPSRATPATA
jgi:glycine/D-amino acid oxidase-like deaminating enzyme